MLKSAERQAAARDARLNDAIEAARAQVSARGGRAVDPAARAATLQALRMAEQEARASAQALVDTGFQSIDVDVKNAIKMAEAGRQPGRPRTARQRQDHRPAARRRRPGQNPL